MISTHASLERMNFLSSLSKEGVGKGVEGDAKTGDKENTPDGAAKGDEGKTGKGEGEIKSEEVKEDKRTEEEKATDAVSHKNVNGMVFSFD